MHPIVEIGRLHLPAYGLLGLLSLFVLVMAGMLIIYKSGLSLFDGTVLGAYGVLGAFVGSKILYYFEHPERFTLYSPSDLLDILRSGGAAYGGIIVGLLFCLAGSRIHKIDLKAYFDNTVFLLPLCHGIWKIGCLCAGCCYGIEYSGTGFVVFEESKSAPAGVALFPVQILEVIFLFELALFLFLFRKRSWEIYLLIYSVGRFFIEFFRNERIKNTLGIFSDVQFLCVIILILLIVKYFVRSKTYE